MFSTIQGVRCLWRENLQIRGRALEVLRTSLFKEAMIPDDLEILLQMVMIGRLHKVC